jgi:hypothetical protein
MVDVPTEVGLTAPQEIKKMKYVRGKYIIFSFGTQINIHLN